MYLAHEMPSSSSHFLDSMAPLPLYDAAPRPSAPRRIAMAVAGTSNAISIYAHAKLVAFCLTLMMAFVTVNNHKVVDANTNALVSSTMNAASAMRLASCPEVSPQDRVVMFWQSEVDGCEQIPYGVTHVVFGFAQTFEGRVNPVFQTSPDVIKRCVQLLRQRCVYSMGAVGGANNNDGMSSINDPYAFAASVKAFLDEFGFDGVDIDDETTKYQGNYDPNRVNTYMQVLHSMLKGQGNNYLISYDSYMFEGSLGCWQTSRCFAKGIENYVDWINIMAYNIDRNPDRAGVRSDIHGAASHLVSSTSTRLRRPASLKNGVVSFLATSSPLVSAWTQRVPTALGPCSGSFSRGSSTITATIWAAL
ncbi:hypothetical protein AC1031_020033 [Aphanomyces cochlioides]|nr:hypothetical protein AC1031_020033 [Aphanomyces cochlioides]